LDNPTSQRLALAQATAGALLDEIAAAIRFRRVEMVHLPDLCGLAVTK
jgi:hypothetical protein